MPKAGSSERGEKAESKKMAERRVTAMWESARKRGEKLGNGGSFRKSEKWVKMLAVDSIKSKEKSNGERALSGGKARKC